MSFPVPVSPISVVEELDLESGKSRRSIFPMVLEFGDPPDDEFLFRCFFFFLSEDGGTISG